MNIHEYSFINRSYKYQFKHHNYIIMNQYIIFLPLNLYFISSKHFKITLWNITYSGLKVSPFWLLSQTYDVGKT